MIHATFTMRSCALDMDTKVDVLMPENRHVTMDTRGKKYPVLYVLHGMKEDNSSWLHLSNLFLMCRDLDLIVVMPAVQKSFYTDSKYGLDYYTYITEELPTKLKNYLPISDRWEDTFIMGESMGGYGTMKCALGKPEKYAKAVCLSGTNFPETFQVSGKFQVGNFGTQEEALSSDNNLKNLITKLKDRTEHLPEMMFYCGVDDKLCYAGCKDMEETLKKELPNMKVSGEYWAGEHNFFFWNQAIPKALKWFGFDIKQDSVI